jgi:hypothetical protein
MLCSPLPASGRGAGGEVWASGDGARNLSPLTPLPEAGRGEPGEATEIRHP